MSGDTDRPSGVVVLADGGLAAPWARLLGAVGWRVRPLDETALAAPDGDAPRAWWIEVVDRATAAAAVRAALGGAALVVGCGPVPDARRCARDLANAATVVDRRGHAPRLGDADEATLRALVAIGGGATVASAARTLEVSLRTLHRRLGEARVATGAATNSAAAVALARDLQGLPRP